MTHEELLIEYRKLKETVELAIEYIEENERSINLGVNNTTYETIYTPKKVNSKEVLKILRREDGK